MSPEAEPLHAGHDRLDGEERGPFVDRHALVIVGRRDRLESVPVIACNVVDQHREVPEFGLRSGDRGLQRRHIAHVADAPPRRRVPGRNELLRELAAGALGDVDEGDMRTLLGEGADDRRTDSGGAAGDEDGAAAQARILRAATGGSGRR